MVSVDRLQGISGDLGVKCPVRVATTANITLSGLQTIDGITVVAGDRVLVKDQTNAADNGIWNATTSSWSRALDFDAENDAVAGTLVIVSEGTVNGGAAFRVANTGSITIGTTLLSFVAHSLGSLSSSAGSSLIGFIQAGTGAVLRTVQSKLRDTVSVQDFGAVGDDATDDGAAFQAALDYCAANGLALFIPAGTYRINRRLTQAAKSVAIYGEGKYTSLLRFDNTAAAASGIALTLDFYSSGPPNNWDTASLSGFGLIADGVLTSPAISLAFTAVAFDGNRKIKIDNVSIFPKTFGTHLFSSGLYIEKAVGVGIYHFEYIGDNARTSKAISMKECFDVTVIDPNIDFASDAIYATDTVTNQFEGLQVTGGTLNNVTRGIVGVKTGGTSCVYVSAIGTHIAAIGSAIDFTDIDQWFLDSCLLYMSGAGTINGSTVSIGGGSDSGSMRGCTLSQNTVATGVTGIKFADTSTNIIVANNTISTYATGINRGTLTGYSFDGNLFYNCTANFTGTVAGHERLIDLSSGAQTLPIQPAFMAYLAASTLNDKTGDGTGYILTGFTEVFDQGGDFDGTSFTAPVTGRYEINCNVTLANIAAGHTKAVLYVVSSNRTYMSVINAAAAAVAGDLTLTMPMSVVADMDAGDIVQLQLSVHNSTKTVGVFGSGNLLTHFSAALVC